MDKLRMQTANKAMVPVSKIKVFEGRKIRAQWDSNREDWLLSVVDVVEILTDSRDYQTARNYWKVLKNRLKKEGSELVTNCYRLKLTARDGKLRETDVLDTKGILRLVQSIPSPKAEPFKVWLAQVGSERLDEIADPEKADEVMPGRSISYCNFGDETGYQIDQNCSDRQIYESQV